MGINGKNTRNSDRNPASLFQYFPAVSRGNRTELVGNGPEADGSDRFLPDPVAGSFVLGGFVGILSDMNPYFSEVFRSDMFGNKRNLSGKFRVRILLP